VEHHRRPPGGKGLAQVRQVFHVADQLDQRQARPALAQFLVDAVEVELALLVKHQPRRREVRHLAA